LAKGLWQKSFLMKIMARDQYPWRPANHHSDSVKMYGGVGCAIGGGFNLAMPAQQIVVAKLLPFRF
jgi:hypothetical protein